MTGTSAIIPASGLGKRLSVPGGKSFVHIAGQPMLAHTLRAFQDCGAVDEIVLVVQHERAPDAHALIHDFGLTKVAAVVAGGENRQDSVRNGLALVSPGCDIVAVHDGARPLVTSEVISATVDAARTHGAAIAAVPVVDTIKSSVDGSLIIGTLDRDELYAVQTPQTFQRAIIEEAFESAYADGWSGTDDASMVERLGIPVRLVWGSYENIKVTTAVDLVAAEAIMNQRVSGYGLRVSGFPRVGHGYDSHRLVPDRKLYLGGVEIPFELGLLGHSDADVLIHAVIDALLGAAGAGDIGRHFPDTDPAYKDIRSTELLKRAATVLEESGWRVANLDITLIAERPKIAAHVPAICENIAGVLGITPQQVNVKGKTAEGLGPVGEGLAMECFAVAMLIPIS